MNPYQKVIKAIEDGKDFCNEVNVYWRMIDEEINQLSSFVKSIKNKKYVQNFHYSSHPKAEEHEEWKLKISETFLPKSKACPLWFQNIFQKKKGFL